jgi:hypothetical protein
MRGSVVGKIVASKSAKYPKGTYVGAPAGWAEFAVLGDDNKDMVKVELPKEGRLTDALGVLGLCACFLYFLGYLLFGGETRISDIKFRRERIGAISLMLPRTYRSDSLFRHHRCWAGQSRRFCCRFRRRWSNWIRSLPDRQAERSESARYRGK